MAATWTLFLSLTHRIGVGRNENAFGMIPAVITDSKEKEFHTIFTQTTTPGANKMEENLLCACVAEVADGRLRKKKKRMIEAENSLGGKGGVMWRAEKNSKWKDGRLNYVFTGESTACEQTKGWQDAPPLFSDWRLDSSPSSWWQPLPLSSLCRCSCQCPISTLKTITRLPEGGHSAESADKSGRLPVTVCGGMLRRRIWDEKEEGRGAERMDESF